MSDPAMKGNAVRDVLQYVAKIQDRVERLEVAKAVADGFKVPEAVIYEQLHLTPGRPEIRPRAKAVKMMSKQMLTETEKQLIHGLLQDRQLGRSIEPHLNEEFLKRIWSFSILEGLTRQTERSLEEILTPLEDDELRKQVRAVDFEEVRAQVTVRDVESCVQQLRLAYLVKQEEEVQEQLKSYVSIPAPIELVQRKIDIAAQKRSLSP
jgi:hypothetical protein